MAVDGARVFSAEQILAQSSAYPPMAEHECQISTLILSAAYPVLRYVKGTRARLIASPGTEPAATEVLHWWNEMADGTVVDSAFQPRFSSPKQLPHVTLRYLEGETSEAERREADSGVRSLRRAIQQRMKTGTGTADERRRRVVEELRDDLPRLRRDFDPGVVVQSRILRGGDAIAESAPGHADGFAVIPPAFRRTAH